MAKYKVKEGKGELGVHSKFGSFKLKNATQTQLKQLASIGYQYVELDEEATDTGKKRKSKQDDNKELDAGGADSTGQAEGPGQPE